MGLSFDFNFFPMFVAALVSFFVGWIWFGPLFGGIWMDAMKLSRKERGKKVPILLPLIFGFLLAIIGTYAIAVFIQSLGISGVSNALLLGLIIWFGFFFTMHFGNGMWENKDIRIFFLYSAHDLVRILLICIILVVLA